MAMARVDPEREERRREQKELPDSLRASGALDEIFALELPPETGVGFVSVRRQPG